MEPGGVWERLLQTPTTWIVVAAVLFVIAVVFLVAGALAGRRARRDHRAAVDGRTVDGPPGDDRATATPVAGVPAPEADEDDAVTEPAAPGRGPAPLPADEEDPVTEPAVPRRPAPAQRAVGPSTPTGQPGVEPSTPSRQPGVSGSAAHRLLGALVGDPNGALAGVAALERGEEPGRAAVTLLRSGVPAPAVARLCGVDEADLGDLVATTLGILPTEARSVVSDSVGSAPEPAPAPTS
ncbi:hypothetical protein LQ327_05690 [Actinomycetospora endophytica]|uniref:Magnesium transporter MgtE intracellular domain-containing protein n=1 Tax=Actinomycetospora endophytica TaxID=2291215 RepID=A0ABS8P749_9PSEU|nr:hypothetical protein [Actinomycetospora endophytica]MCD2192879.1 hypothetical protein [Actinomycetospora endophytica]